MRCTRSDGGARCRRIGGRSDDDVNDGDVGNVDGWIGRGEYQRCNAIVPWTKTRIGLPMRCRLLLSRLSQLSSLAKQLFGSSG